MQAKCRKKSQTILQRHLTDDFYQSSLKYKSFVRILKIYVGIDSIFETLPFRAIFQGQNPASEKRYETTYLRLNINIKSLKFIYGYALVIIILRESGDLAG